MQNQKFWYILLFLQGKHTKDENSGSSDNYWDLMNDWICSNCDTQLSNTFHMYWYIKQLATIMNSHNMHCSSLNSSKQCKYNHVFLEKFVAIWNTMLPVYSIFRCYIVALITAISGL